jgi:hypothetical protein
MSWWTKKIDTSSIHQLAGKLGLSGTYKTKRMLVKFLTPLQTQCNSFWNSFLGHSRKWLSSVFRVTPVSHSTDSVKHPYCTKVSFVYLNVSSTVHEDRHVWASQRNFLQMETFRTYSGSSPSLANRSLAKMSETCYRSPCKGK